MTTPQERAELVRNLIDRQAKTELINRLMLRGFESDDHQFKEDMRKAAALLQADAEVGGEAVAWRTEAAKWLRRKAEDQNATNRQYPEHAKCYPEWGMRARWISWLADELEAEQEAAPPGLEPWQDETRPQQAARVPLTDEDVEWVVNDMAELGVKIGDQFFWLYKGYSLVYEDAKHDDGSPIMWRVVGKREFGECCHPVKFWREGARLPERYTEELVYTPGLSFGKPDDGKWKPLPRAHGITTQTPPPGHILCLTCDGKGYQPMVDEPSKHFPDDLPAILKKQAS